MDMIQLYNDFNIHYITEGHKHCRPGFINTPCPFCISEPGHEGYHLSYHLQNNYFVCWRCGWKPVSKTIAKLLNIYEKEAITILQNYGEFYNFSIIKEQEKKIRTLAHHFPSNTGPLMDSHKKYLISRNFDPEYIEKEFKILGTGPYSKLSTAKNTELDYKYRIIIPFFWNGNQVSFDSRDITGKAVNKYQACPLEREIIPHKNILYGKQEMWKTTGICVEGPTDVWRFGAYSFATSGIKFTNYQLRTIHQHFKRIAVCFDGGEPEAKEQANKLVAELKFRGVDAFRVDIIGDPGSMDQKEADYLIKQLIK